jgi:uncharacterized membrane protein
MCRLGLLALLGISACGVGDGTLADVDPESVPADVAYTTHVQPRIDHYCTSCHNPDGLLGNAGGWDFSSYQRVRGAIDLIRQVAFEEKSMPPGGARRMSVRDAAILERWQATGFPQ